MPNFVNTVDNVRIENGLLFFKLGSVGPGRNGEAEFTPSSDIVMRSEDAGELFKFLMHKISEHVFSQNEVDSSSQEAETFKVDGPRARKKLLTST